MSQSKAQLLDPQGDFTLTGQLIGVGATFSGNVSIAGTLTKQDVTNVDSVGLITARSGIKVASGNILLTGGNNTKVSFAGDGSAHYIKMDTTLNGPVINGYGGIAFETAGANERLRINSNGQVSIRGTNTAFDTTGDLNSLQLYYEQDSGQASIGPYSNGGNTQLSFYTNSGGAAATEKLRITSQGSVGINSTSPVGTLDVTTTTGSQSSVFIYAANHDASAASQAELRFGFAHSGSPEGIGYIKLKENGTNVFDGNLVFGVPNNNGSGGSVTNDVLFIKGSNQRVGIGSETPHATLDVNGSFINSNSVNSTGDAGIQVSNGHRLGFDESGTRSWTVKATGGNLEVQSGDGNGSLKGASSGGVHDHKGNLRSVPLNTQGSAYTLVAADAGKAILASNSVTFNNSVMSAGDMVTIINNTNGNISIIAGAGTALYNTADAATGTRTLATRGMATIYFTHNTTGYISGSGLS